MRAACASEAAFGAARRVGLMLPWLLWDNFVPQYAGAGDPVREPVHDKRTYERGRGGVARCVARMQARGTGLQLTGVGPKNKCDDMFAPHLNSHRRLVMHEMWLHASRDVVCVDSSDLGFVPVRRRQSVRWPIRKVEVGLKRLTWHPP